jgi:soluble lytic murein transglycosylase
MKRLTIALAASAAVTVPALAPTDSVTGKEPVHEPDSALMDLGAGRFWHAARRLRAAGVQGAEQTLLLARAEAGWNNWGAVVELLAGVHWLDEEGEGDGWYLLGRAYEAEGRWSEAIAAYARYPARGADAIVPAVRRARASGMTGDHEAALGILDALGAGSEAPASWVALELARNAAEDGDTAAVSAYQRSVVDGGARSAAWRLRADAALAAGDSVRGLAEFRALLDVPSASRRAIAATETGLLLRSSGDTIGARAILLGALEDAPASTAGRAAAALLDDGSVDRTLALRLGRILDRAGDGRRALRAYDVAAGRDPAAMPEWARLARARLMATVRSRQGAALEEFRAIRASTQDPGIGARNLELWAAMRGRQGRTDAVNTLRRWLVEEYPASSQAATVLWNRGFSAEGRRDLAGALASYARLVEVAGSQPRAGQARMRMGQIRLAQGRVADAAAVFDGYLEEYPRGRRWEDASYWSASTHLSLGDTGLARGRVERIRAEAPLSYYAVMGADLLSEPYEVDVPAGSLPVRPGWLEEGLRRLDLLAEAGLDAGAQAEVDRMVDRAGESPEAMLTLAEELLDRGRTVEGINLGWALRRQGQAWDRRLLEVVYPFPYRDLVVREAEEWGVDPFMLAAIIRQESAFKADIVSHAGAVGLMQVMPPTGAALARAHGPAGFDEESLTMPEVNLHLGAAFFVEMSGRYAEQLPIVLSAYNAGPTRANRWQRYPEASDPVRFTERIPFDETRGYVKNVRRNLWLYQALYGER